MTSDTLDVSTGEGVSRNNDLGGIYVVIREVK